MELLVGEELKVNHTETGITGSARLVLAGDGVFPITKDKHGNILKHQPNTGIDIAGTIQGEGKLAGTPSLFIRLASCNLRCVWQMDDGSFCKCDTSYASFRPENKSVLQVGDIVDLVRHNIGNMQHVVITGGEPMLQKEGLAELCRLIKKELHLHITVETNGTIFDKEVAQYIDLFSISPKLSNSVPSKDKLEYFEEGETGASKFHHEVRRNLNVLQSYIYFANSLEKDLQLKFVVGKASDAAEIKNDYLDLLMGYSQNDILLMPLGASQQQITQSTPIVLKMCIQNGWKFTPRVHIDLFGSKQGV